jgi:hypothetical protein
MSNVDGDRTCSFRSAVTRMDLTEDDNLSIRCFEKTCDVMYIFALPVDSMNMFELYREFSVEDCVCHVCGFS